LYVSVVVVLVAALVARLIQVAHSEVVVEPVPIKTISQSRLVLLTQ
jgi:hypothetical protein